MSRLLINIDLGERGANHPIDQALVPYADIVNLACGGHAGDAATIAAFKRLAEQHGAVVSAHLSYPDRANFGRRPMAIKPAELIAALRAQRALLPEPQLVKFHGALYHAADTQKGLAHALADWLKSQGFNGVITPSPGRLAEACRQRGLNVIAEAFVERRYWFNPQRHRPELLDRSNPQASLTETAEAMAQADDLIKHRAVRLYPNGQRHRVEADTLCLHSDSPIALCLAQALASRLRGDASA